MFAVRQCQGADVQPHFTPESGPFGALSDCRRLVVLNDRENILSALREKPLKVYEVMKRANVVNEEACQSLLLKMRDEGLVKFDIHKGLWLIGSSANS